MSAMLAPIKEKKNKTFRVISFKITVAYLIQPLFVHNQVIYKIFSLFIFLLMFTILIFLSSFFIFRPDHAVFHMVRT